MIFSAIPNIAGNAESINFITALGYPAYFIPFIGVAKLLGSLAILAPGYFRLKEWAYAGLFFDLLGAFYSLIQVHGFDASMSVMILIIAVGALSYLFYHKLYNQKAVVA
jgi:DoxX-like family